MKKDLNGFKKHGGVTLNIDSMTDNDRRQAKFKSKKASFKKVTKQTFCSNKK